MNSTGRPSSPPLALTSSRQMSIAACSILPAGALPPVSERPAPTLIGGPLWAVAPESPIRLTSVAAASDRSALRRPFIIVLPCGRCARVKSLLSRLAVGVDQLAGRILRRPHDRLRLAVAELVEIAGLRVLDLGPDLARLGPLAVCRKREVAGHGLE